MKRLFFSLLLALLLLASACAASKTPAPVETPGAEASDIEADASVADAQPQDEFAPSYDALQWQTGAELLYAEQFAIDATAEGYQRITIAGTDTYLVVPEGAAVPSGVPESVVVLQQPLDKIYLVASSAMDLFRELDAICAIRLSGLDESDWYIEEARQAMADGEMLYAGKYSAPDYERILDEGCDLAIESTMIYHTPEVKEQLERFGVPVLVERSSYESHPLGRMEWIKLYAALLGKQDEAAAYYDRQMQQLAPILEQENTGKTVAFFYITSAGAVNVRKPGDYIAKAIDLAGGVYVPSDIGSEEENALSTMNMQMESFYAAARDADVLIYNSTIDAELQSLDDLLAKSSVLQNFKAVREGNVWCAGKNLFQESLGLGDLILDIHAILSADGPDSLETTYLYHLD